MGSEALIARDGWEWFKHMVHGLSFVAQHGLESFDFFFLGIVRRIVLSRFSFHFGIARS
jgi:hypothetical protein